VVFVGRTGPQREGRVRKRPAECEIGRDTYVRPIPDRGNGRKSRGEIKRNRAHQRLNQYQHFFSPSSKKELWPRKWRERKGGEIEEGW